MRMPEGVGRGVREGMVVRTADGHDLGRVVRVGEDTFTVEKGWLVPRDWVVRHDEVADVEGGEVTLSFDRRELEPQRPTAAEERRVERAPFGEPQEVVVELAHEQATPHVVLAEVGSLRIRKVVRTEVQHFQIPVRREEIVVERVAPREAVAGDAQALAPEPGELGGAPFEERSFVLPLREERVEFTKRAVVWQEVRVSERAVEEVARVKTRVRRETAEVTPRGAVDQEGSPEGYDA